MTTDAASGSLLSRSVSHSALATPIRVISVVLAVALTAAAAHVTTPLPFTSVPFTLTPMVVLLTSAALGARLGFATQMAYLAAGAAGLPVFAPSAVLPPGALRLIGPTGGYLLAYPLAAWVTGSLAERGWDRRYWTSAAAMFVGLTVIFAGGVSWLMVLHHSLSTALSAGLLPFILADIVKVLAAAMILPLAGRYFPNTSKY